MYSLTYTLLFIQSSDILYIVSFITKNGLFDFQLVIFNTSLHFDFIFKSKGHRIKGLLKT